MLRKTLGIIGIFILNLIFIANSSSAEQHENQIAKINRVTVPNLVVSIRVNKQDVNPGDTLQYIVYFSNALTDTAKGVSLVDIFPEKCIFQSNLNPGWKENSSGDSLFYQIGTLAPMDSDSIALKLIVMDQGQFSSGFHNLLDVVEIRDESGLYKNKDAVISKLFLMPDVYVRKTHQPEYIGTMFNAPLRYTIVVGNKGNHTARDVVVNDTLSYLLRPVKSIPLPFKKSALISSTTPDTVLTWTVSTIAPGDSFKIILDTQLSSYDLLGIDMIVNSVAAIEKDEQNLFDNSYRDTTYFVSGGGVAVRDLIISKTDGKNTANAGDTLTYLIKYKNKGNLFTRDVAIHEYFPNNGKFINFDFVDKVFLKNYHMTSTGVIWNLNMLAPGDSGLIRLKFLISDSLALGKNILVDSVMISSLTLGEVEYKNNKAIDITLVYAERDLQIEKTDNIDSISPGGILTYKINYWNRGSLPTGNIKIMEFFPEFVKYQRFQFENSKHLADSTIYPDRIEWVLNTLSPNDSGKITLVFNVPDSIPIGTFPLLDSIRIESSQDQNNYNNDMDIDTTLLIATRDLSIEKSANKDTLLPGDTLEYKIKFYNHGNMAAKDVVVFDSLLNRENLENIFDISSNGQIGPNSSEIIWRIDKLLPQEKDSITFKINVKKFSNLLEQKVANYVRISTSDTESIYRNNSDTAWVNIYYKPKLELRIEHFPEEVGTKDSCSYILFYRNVGTAQAKRVMLVDTMPSYLSLSGDTTSYQPREKWSVSKIGKNNISSILSFNIGDLSPGMKAWKEIKIFALVDSFLPNNPVLLKNRGKIADSTGIADYAVDSLYVRGSQFRVSVLIQSIEQSLPPKSLYLGSQFKVRMEINKPIVSGNWTIDYPDIGIPGLSVPVDSINKNYIYETPVQRVPAEAGFGKMRIVFHGESIFGEKSDSSDIGNILKPPESFHLNRNAINVASGEMVQARFSISNPEHANIRIYTIAGELVKKLYDKQLAVAGEDQVNWDGKNDRGQFVSSGVYLIYLKTPSFEEVKKVIIIR